MITDIEKLLEENNNKNTEKEDNSLVENSIKFFEEFVAVINKIKKETEEVIEWE